MKADPDAAKVVWTCEGTVLVARFSGAPGTVFSEPPSELPVDRATSLQLRFEKDDPGPATLAAAHRAARWASGRNLTLETEGTPETLRRLLALSLGTPLQPVKAEAAEPGLLHRLGETTFEAFGKTVAVTSFIGQITLSVLSWIAGRSVTRTSDIFDNFLRCGPGSLTIVALIAFLVGLIISFVAAVQLALFGASIFVADLIAIVMFRELGVMMTGILLSGRIGAAFAAELGSMKNNEEIDALETSGVNPVQFLVVPRFLALVLATPLLSVFASYVGVLGGLMMASGLMGVVPEQFFARVLTAMTLGNFWAGIIKGFFFGAIIAITGCMKGLSAKRGAEGVGEAATSAVVTSITWIIVADAIFAILLYFLGI